MAFKNVPQAFSAKINTVVIGTGDNAVAIGGENVFPFYTFDAPIENAPKIGVEVSDLGIDDQVEGIKEYYAGATNIVERAQKAAQMEGAAFICLRFDGADPAGMDRSVEDCVADAKAVAEAVDFPIVIAGCKNVEKDQEIFEKVASELAGKNILVLSAREENYKSVGASAGLAYNQKVGAESAVDINLAKQLNVLMTQLGVAKESIVMNLGSAAAGYGYEYVASTLDRVKAAALTQNDEMLQMPIITPVSFETYAVKEALADEAEMPEWGPQEDRAVNMEVCTASACLTAGSDAVILRHPKSVSTISKMIDALM